MHGPHSLIRCGKYVRPFGSVPVNCTPLWDPIGKPRRIYPRMIVWFRRLHEWYKEVLRGLLIDEDQCKEEKITLKLAYNNAGIKQTLFCLLNTVYMQQYFFFDFRFRLFFFFFWDRVIYDAQKFAIYALPSPLQMF